MSSSLTILLIDGNFDDLDYYSERLRRSSPDYVVIQAATGRTGLTICNNRHIDCVILELDLPDMSGFEVLLKLIPIVRHPEMAVIVLTRISNAYLLDAAIVNGAQAALRKTMASGDILDHAIFKAIGAIPRSSKEAPPSTI
jgi:DNA-binding NarL/FixJ family response regulator